MRHKQYLDTRWRETGYKSSSMTKEFADSRRRTYSARIAMAQRESFYPTTADQKRLQAPHRYPVSPQPYN